MNNARDITLKILDAIDFSDNREAHADEILQNINLLSLVNLMQSLPVEKQTEVKQQLSENEGNPEKIAALLKEHFSQQQLHQALEKTTKDTITQYIQTIMPTLSANHKEKLLRVMEEVEQIQAA
jgi:DNA-binding GntR family transcriptional regulator